MNVFFLDLVLVAQTRLEIAHTLAQIAHDFRQLPRAKKHQNNDDQQNHMCEA